MIDQLRNHIDELFRDTPKTKNFIDLREEMFTNLVDKYTDLINQGINPQEAYQIAIEGIGDIDEVIDSLKSSALIAPHVNQKAKQKSAILVSVAVMLYIFSFIPVILLDNDLSIVIMFCFWAVATGLLIYNGMTAPKYKRIDDTVVEQFKEFNSVNPQNKRIKSMINTCVWSLAVVIFLLLGFLGGLWYIAWLIFIIAIPIAEILKTIVDIRS